MNYALYHPSQADEIRHLFFNTFSDSEGQSEGLLVSGLAYDLMTKTQPPELEGYVAKQGNQIAGCILFSRMTFESNVNAYLLSPVAVATQYQGKGVGQALIRYGLEQLKSQGVELVTTYGDPNYYSRVGFHPVDSSVVMPPYPLSQPQGWLAQSLAGKNVNAALGRPTCVEAFCSPELW